MLTKNKHDTCVALVAFVMQNTILTHGIEKTPNEPS